MSPRPRRAVAQTIQRATGASVVAAGNDDPAILCELHSHGNMSPFGSRTDDADEPGACIYAVIGRLGTAPEIHDRMGVYGGYWHPLPVTAVFTGNGGFTDLTKKENDPCPSSPSTT
ncbi:MAG: Mov34/MPN/PAD-1 family protein [Candidatus Promineifilaceae bacterium]